MSTALIGGVIMLKSKMYHASFAIPVDFQMLTFISLPCEMKFARIKITAEFKKVACIK